jgi:hypothetical protein
MPIFNSNSANLIVQGSSGLVERALSDDPNDTNVRGEILREVIEAMVSGDTLLVGPGSFGFSDIQMPDNTRIIGSGKRTIFTPDVADGSTKLRPGDNCTIENMFFSGIGADGISHKTTGGQVEVSNVIIRNCRFSGLSDFIIGDMTSDYGAGLNKIWRIENCDFIGTGAAGANDLCIFTGDYYDIRVWNCYFHNVNPGSGPLDSCSFDFGSGTVGTASQNSILRVWNSLFLTQPVSNPSAFSAGVTSLGQSTVRLIGCEFVTNDGSFANPSYSLYSNNGNIEYAGCIGVDVETFTANGGTIDNVESA